MSAIHLALASDANPAYLCGLTVAAGSALRHLPPHARAVIHILDLGIPDAAFAECAAILSGLHPQAEVRRHPIDAARFEGLPTWRGSLAIYARLILPSLVDAEWCIYADCDLLFTADPNRLLALADKSMLCQGHLNPRDATVDRREFEWFADNHIPIDPNRYLCSGLLLLNLGLFRALNAEQQCFDFLSRHPDVYFPDQTVLNAVCHGRTKVLPDDWGMLTWHNPAPMRVPVGAVHFAGDAPWVTLSARDRPACSAAHLLWIKTARQIIPATSFLAKAIPSLTAFCLRKWLPFRLWRALPRWVAAPPWVRNPKRRAKRLWLRRAEPMPAELM